MQEKFDDELKKKFPDEFKDAEDVSNKKGIFTPVDPDSQTDGELEEPEEE